MVDADRGHADAVEWPHASPTDSTDGGIDTGTTRRVVSATVVSEADSSRVASVRAVSPPRQPPSSGSGDGLGFVLNHVAHAMTREFELELHRFGVRVVHLSVLRVLSSDGPSSQQHLADRLGLRRSTMVGVVRDLVERGYVDRASKDGRAYSLSLTDAGQRFHGEVLAFAIEHEQRAFAALTVRERDTLARLLRKLGSAGPRPRILDGHGDVPTR